MLVIAYIPCGSKAEAEKIGKTLVKERLAACANVYESSSMYMWKGKMEKAKESVIFAKTTAEKFEKLKKRAEKIHSYDIPCIIAIPVVDGNDAYLDWAEKQVK